MKKQFAAGVLLLVLLVATAVAWADSTDPGSSSDPVVTKSYVDAQIATLKASASTSFTVIFVESGKTLYGEEGTELILRSGTAVAVDNGTNGLSDLTKATELMSGGTVEKNHLIIVPRDDGRGISAKTDIYVMVKGGYSIS